MAESIEARYQAALGAVKQALLAAGRPIDAARIIAVSKRQPHAAIQAAYAAGARDFGENHAQELVPKALHFAAQGLFLRWHFIGQLQRNKVPLILPFVHMIHSVDRMPLVDSLVRTHAQLGMTRPIQVLLQVRTGPESGRGGAPADDVVPLAEAVWASPALRLRGVMAVAPNTGDPIPAFRLARAVYETLRTTSQDPCIDTLSLGMSNDYPQGIAEGATLVRLGHAIFGARPG